MAKDNDRFLKEFDKWLDDVYSEIEAGVQQITEYVAESTLKDAKNNTPVDTGYLRRSIQMNVEDGGMASTVYAGAEYALFVELGTYKMLPQPFLFPAFNKYTYLYVQEIERLLKNL